MKSDNILAFVGGAILGAVAAILLAPDSGENTRAKIKAKADETYKDIKEKVREGREKFQKKSEAEADAAAE
ncbi:MAG: YtxH domain-containing protein [Bacteroidales bacterium]|jgi:gas vesicle protein|nr:YtxH domain-containing protein [Bacteroidales bacterium]MCI1733973.1 YtxH domain-containing protein [Bacteroidales bacterium]